mmetsp:Transcript_38650/g.93072  ORF Transcript_38650/g.93072 Transcript_38650/m.93072 type:complete len:493 (-) Transcript_38650:1304-2782(-)
MRRRRSSSDATGVENNSDATLCPSVGRLGIYVEGNAEKNAMDSKPEMRPILASSPTRQTISLRHCRRFYFLHSALSLAVVVLGMMHNGGDRKYIPVKPKELFNLISDHTSKASSGAIIGDGTAQQESCSKAYINVHSSAIEEEFAAICCSRSDWNSQFSNRKQYQSNLCHPQIPIMGLSTQHMPFARRLTHLTEAWVLPLLPILIRILYQLLVLIYSSFTMNWNCQNQGGSPIQREATSLSKSRASLSSSSSSSPSFLTAVAQPHISNHNLIIPTLRRLLFYFLLLNFRGWGLYIGANALEDFIILPWLTGNTVISPMRTNSMSDEEHDLRYSSNEPDCWYKEILKAHHKSSMENDGNYDCYGRPFDFSDHVVLFLAHYLPIFVMEMLLYYSYPFWGITASEKSTSKRSRATGIMFDGFHFCLFFYLHLIVFHALYQTAVYFHTRAEILVGYAVSLMLQLPVMYMMCTERSRGLRKYFGFPCEETVTSVKGN